ncbi:thioesterase [Rhodococcus gordoniae]|uniref:Thioesterase n=1 Tax=Rhodococcus gordoniae TaxID=223392 RepID=A0A379LZX8_9NOCA|nr:MULTISPECIES: PaaI family thioesterase [Rhodococcus]UTT48240.1 PaaI family thioesterase [Rhodococcus gordoniae]SUE15611.1 thioesterase [Rhodococcus gordoniae]
MAIETAQFSVDRPGRVMGVDIEIADDASVSITQAVGPHLFDHRGQTTLASVGVFTDFAAGVPAGIARFAETGERPQGVLSHVTATLAHPFPSSGLLVGRGSSLYYDDSTAVSRTDVHDEQGVLVAHLVGRSIVVGRTPTELGPDAAETVPERGEPEPWSDAAILAELPGLDIVTGISTGTLPRGPLAGLLGLEVTAAEHGVVQARLSPREWMANVIGSVQGGVLVSMAEAVTGLAAQTLTGIGQDYRVLEIGLDYLRSPAVPGPVVELRSEAVRAGRRLASFETTLCAADGTVYVRAHANVRLFPRA